MKISIGRAQKGESVPERGDIDSPDDLLFGTSAGYLYRRGIISVMVVKN